MDDLNPSVGPDPSKTPDGEGLPDLSARPAGWLGSGLLVGSILAVTRGAVGAYMGLASAGLTLVAFQFLPQLDKKSKLWGMASSLSFGAAFLFTPLAAPLIGVGILTALISAGVQQNADKQQNLSDAMRNMNHVSEIHKIDAAAPSPAKPAPVTQEPHSFAPAGPHPVMEIAGTPLPNVITDKRISDLSVSNARHSDAPHSDTHWQKSVSQTPAATPGRSA